jgi:predicted phage replisome organizer
MGEVEWIKLYLRTFRESRKIGAIENMKNGDTLVLIWIKLLCLAGEINDGGAVYITEGKPYNVDMLAVDLKKPRAIVETALRVFAEYGMILRDDAGFIQVLNWEKYQSADRLDEIRKQATERKRRERARKKQDSARDMSRDCHATHSTTVTPCHGIEEEKEGDQENHSFDLSRASEQEHYATDKERAKRELMGGELGGGVVMISGEEFDKLADELSLDELTHYIGVVRDCELKGQKFRRKTHFQAIMEMAMADRAKASKQRTSGTRPPRLPKNQPTGNSTFDVDDMFRANVAATFGDDFDFDMTKKQQ